MASLKGPPMPPARPPKAQSWTVRRCPSPTCTGEDLISLPHLTVHGGVDVHVVTGSQRERNKKQQVDKGPKSQTSPTCLGIHQTRTHSRLPIAKAKQPRKDPVPSLFPFSLPLPCSHSSTQTTKQNGPLPFSSPWPKSSRGREPQRCLPSPCCRPSPCCHPAAPRP